MTSQLGFMKTLHHKLKVEKSTMVPSGFSMNDQYSFSNLLILVQHLSHLAKVLQRVHT